MLVGMGKATVQLGDDCFPLDGFTGVHDPLYVRMLLLESGEAQARQRYGILSVDLTSMFPKTVAEYKHILQDLADVKDENSWIAATHTFSSPHLWDVPQPGKPDIVRPGHPVRTQAEIDRCIRVNKAFFRAVEEAVGQAVSSLCPAYCGAGEGACSVNANRNMETKDGWWLGCDAEGFSDHVVPVMKFETLDGQPIGLVYSYDCQSSVMAMSEISRGGKAVILRSAWNGLRLCRKRIQFRFCGASSVRRSRRPRAAIEVKEKRG